MSEEMFKTKEMEEYLGYTGATRIATPVDLNKVLDQVNDIRTACAIGEGKLEQLPKGEPRRASFCVLARALSNGWEAHVSGNITLSHRGKAPIDFVSAAQALRALGYVADYSISGVHIELTDELSLLVEQFDRHWIPGLILETQ